MASPALLTIRVIADAKKAMSEFDKLNGKLGTVETETGKTSTKFSKFQGVVDKGAKIAAAGFGIVAAAVVKATKAAAEDEQSQSRLAGILKSAAGVTGEHAKAVDEWVLAQARATGMSEDSLRPALGKLVTATGSVTKSQKLMQIAMDVSAGTGKDVTTISQALGKAYNGTVGGLGRLGIATKDASGKTKTFAQIQEDLTKKFGGAAARAADTTTGKYRRFQVSMHQLQVELGQKFLPILGKLADWLNTKVVPAIEGFGKWVKNNQTTVKVLVGIIGGLGGSLIAASAAMRTAGKVKDVAKGIQSGVQAIGRFRDGFKDAAAAQSQFSGAAGTFGGKMSKVWSAMTSPVGLYVIAIVAVIAIFVLLYKKVGWFRDFVNAAWAMIKKVTVDVFNAIKSAIMTAIGFITDHWKAFAIGLATLLLGPLGGLVVAIATHFDKFKAIVSAVVDWFKGPFLTFFKNLPGNIWNFLQGIPSKIGGIFTSLWDTIKSTVTRLGNAVLDYFKNYPENARKNIAAIATKIRDVFVNAWNWAKERAQAIGGAIMTWIKNYPENARKNLAAIVAKVRDVFVNAWNAAKDRAQAIGSAIMTWIKNYPENARRNLSTIVAKVREVFVNAFTTAKQKVIDIGGQIIGWIQGIPGKIEKAGNAFKNAGKWLIDSFVAGLKKLGSIAGTVAKTIMNGVINAINWGIQQINNFIPNKIGIGPVSISLPANPFPKVPTLAQGGIVRSPTLAVLGEAGPEAVVPLGSAGGYVDQRTFINVNGALDPESVARQIKRITLDADRRRNGVTLNRRAGGRSVTTGAA